MPGIVRYHRGWLRVDEHEPALRRSTGTSSHADEDPRRVLFNGALVVRRDFGLRSSTKN